MNRRGLTDRASGILAKNLGNEFFLWSLEKDFRFRRAEFKVRERVKLTERG